MKVLDLFAGAGGWSVAVNDYGWIEDGCEIWEPARATRAAAGMTTPYRDVRDVHIRPGDYRMVLASPPCQTFSAAGKGAGRADLEEVLNAIRERRAPVVADERTALVLEPLRVVLEGVPEFTAWEQTPAVLPIWEACAAVLREHRYSVWTGVVDAVDYGVPQNRKRAVLIARRDGVQAGPPVSIARGRVSMAEALGWPEYFEVISNYGTGGDPKRRGRRPATGPAATVTGRVCRNKVDGRNVTLAEAAALQTFHPEFPFRGTRTEIQMQIGNAIPPMLACAILETFCGS